MIRGHSLSITTALALMLSLLVVTPTEAKRPGGDGGNSPSFQIVALDDAAGTVRDGGALDINNAREVVGYVDDAISGTGRYAACWSITELNGEIQSSLSLLAGGVGAYSINDSGEIVGGGAPGVALYWIDPQAEPVVLDPLDGHDACNALSINNDGVICGRSGILNDGLSSSRAVVWRVNWINGVAIVSDPIELPGPTDGSTAIALANNDDHGFAQVTGYYEAAQGGAVVWTIESLADGSLAASAPSLLDAYGRAAGINNFGIVCGQSDSLAVVWDGPSTQALNRPTKGKNAAPWTRAFDVSDTGVVVGRGGAGTIDARAVVWPTPDGNMTYLESFLGNNSPLLGLESANAVNNFGEIVGTGWNGAFLAVPN